jgi:hypothetical protein
MGKERAASLLLPVVLMLACGKPNPPPATAGASTARPPAETAPPTGPAPDAPQDLEIASLSPDPDRIVRIKGVLAASIGMRLVPEMLVFTLTDSTGTVLAVIKENVQLKEGIRLELVGRYHAVPSPMYRGPGEAPKETVFEVERYLDLP